MKINLSNTAAALDPYLELLKTFVLKEFAVGPSLTNGAMLDAVTEAILASGQIRFGPKPSPESQVEIRRIISLCMAAERPIPFLIPWGSEKPDGSGIDIAELSALKTLRCLQDRIKRFYTPGVDIVIRLEDVSAPHLFYDRMDAAREEARLYCDGFQNVVKIIGAEGFINAWRESSVVSEHTFNQAADQILPTMRVHVHDNTNEEALDDLRALGWKGKLEKETVQYYMDAYAKLYPKATQDEKEYRIARYFAGALARKRLDLMGNKLEWENEFLELSFINVAPGFDRSRLMRRVFYRTLPCGITSQHVPPWRAKGYIKIGGDNQLKPALASFNEKRDYNHAEFELTRGELKQMVRSDYIIEG